MNRLMSSPISISLSIFKSEIVSNDLNKSICSNNSDSNLIKLKSVHGFGSEFKKEFQYTNEGVHELDIDSSTVSLDEHIEKYKSHIINEIKQMRINKIDVHYNIFMKINNKYIGLSIFTYDNKYKTKINKLFDNYKSNIIRLSNILTKQISF